jgi:hypothetical protein
MLASWNERRSMDRISKVNLIPESNIFPRRGVVVSWFMQLLSIVHNLPSQSLYILYFINVCMTDLLSLFILFLFTPLIA